MGGGVKRPSGPTPIAGPAAESDLKPPAPQSRVLPALADDRDLSS
jgi:hypothetical protein